MYNGESKTKSTLFKDEPTTGLDSAMAQGVVQVLNELAQQGRTIVYTIHQPSSDVFSLFHRILLLAKGRMAFQGTKEEALKFFKRYVRFFFFRKKTCKQYIFYELCFLYTIITELATLPQNSTTQQIII